MSYFREINWTAIKYAGESNTLDVEDSWDTIAVVCEPLGSVKLQILLIKRMGQLNLSTKDKFEDRQDVATDWICNTNVKVIARMYRDFVPE